MELIQLRWHKLHGWIWIDEWEDFHLSYKNVLNSCLVFTSIYLKGSSSHLSLASQRWWPHGDLLIMRSVGKGVGMKSKYLRRGLTLAVRVQAGAPVCLGSVCTVSTADQPWISVALHQHRHLPEISSAMSCTCCALCPEADRHCKSCSLFLSQSVSECTFWFYAELKFQFFSSLILPFVYHNCIWQVLTLFTCLLCLTGWNIRYHYCYWY